MASPALAGSWCTSPCSALKIKTLCLPPPLRRGGQRRDVHATSVVKPSRTRSTHTHSLTTAFQTSGCTCGTATPTMVCAAGLYRDRLPWSHGSGTKPRKKEGKPGTPLSHPCWSWDCIREAMPCTSTHLQHLLFCFLRKSWCLLLFVLFCSQ